MEQGFKEYSIKRLNSMLEKRKISIEEIANICIKRTEDAEQAKYAWTSFDPEKLRCNARELQRAFEKKEITTAKKLLGIPVGIKDIFNTIDYPTQMGSDIWKDFTPGNDARVVYNIKNSGGLVAGKTDTAEFAVHKLNKTLNPHDEKRTPGTSSSGSAALIALGVLPLTLGTQTAASIMRPASFCGVYGYKPSFGLIPRTGVLKTADTLDTVGFFTYHLEDMEIVFDVLRVKGMNYPISNRLLSDFQMQSKNRSKTWKIGIVKGTPWQDYEDYTKASFLTWAKKLGNNKNIHVEELEFSDTISKAHEIHSNIYNRSLSYYFKDEYKETEMSPIMKEIVGEGMEINKETFLDSLRKQEMIIDEIDEIFNDYDALITPTTAGSAPLREILEKKDSGLIWTMAHIPTVNIPLFSDANGLPFGLTVVAGKYRDLKLFKLLRELEAQGLIPDKANPVI